MEKNLILEIIKKQLNDDVYKKITSKILYSNEKNVNEKILDYCIDMYKNNIYKKILLNNYKYFFNYENKINFDLNDLITIFKKYNISIQDLFSNISIDVVILNKKNIDIIKINKFKDIKFLTNFFKKRKKQFNYTILKDVYLILLESLNEDSSKLKIYKNINKDLDLLINDTNNIKIGDFYSNEQKYKIESININYELLILKYINENRINYQIEIDNIIKYFNLYFKNKYDVNLNIFKNDKYIRIEINSTNEELYIDKYKNNFFNLLNYSLKNNIIINSNEMIQSILLYNLFDKNIKNTNQNQIKKL